MKDGSFLQKKLKQERKIGQKIHKDIWNPKMESDYVTGQSSWLTLQIFQNTKQ